MVLDQYARQTMTKIKSPKNLYIANSQVPEAGRGVFTSVSIKENEIIETCPVLVLPRKDYPQVKKTILRNYYFLWGKSTSAICFGYGSFFNHSYAPNATYKKKIKNQTIEFIALKNIEKDEEITVNYNYGKPKRKKDFGLKK